MDWFVRSSDVLPAVKSFGLYFPHHGSISEVPSSGSAEGCLRVFRVSKTLPVNKILKKRSAGSRCYRNERQSNTNRKRKLMNYEERLRHPSARQAEKFLMLMQRLRSLLSVSIEGSDLVRVAHAATSSGGHLRAQPHGYPHTADACGSVGFADDSLRSTDRLSRSV